MNQIIRDLETAYLRGNSLDKQYIKELNLFKPIWYFKQQEDTIMCYEPKGIYNKNWVGYPKLWDKFTSKELSLNSFWCKGITFVAGAGAIFLKEDNLFNNFSTLFLICEDFEKVVFLINHKINNYKGLKTKIAKFIKENSYNADVIWTNNPDSFCFKTEVKLRFKSFLDQKAYYQHIADKWIESQKSKKKVIKEEKVEALY